MTPPDEVWLHLYAQPDWHADARILGTREALMGLRAAIDRALSDGEAALGAFAGDGEGYTVTIGVVSRAGVQNAPVPYTADYAKGEARL
jgi:hypothetical protein